MTLWTVAPVWHFKNTTFWKLDFFLSLCIEVPTQTCPLETCSLNQWTPKEALNQTKIYVLLTSSIMDTGSLNIKNQLKTEFKNFQ